MIVMRKKKAPSIKSSRSRWPPPQERADIPEATSDLDIDMDLSDPTEIISAIKS